VKTIPAGLQTHFDSGAHTLAHCIRAQLRSGALYGWTDHDRPLLIDGLTYSPAAGMDTSAIETGAALNVPTMNVRGLLDTAGVTEADVSAGLWDFATIRVFLVNWNDLTQQMKLRRGWLGEVSVTLDFNAEMRGLAQKLQTTIIELASELCKADLFDARCKIVDTEGVWKFTGVALSTVVQAQRQFTAAALVQAADFFSNGKVTFTSGNCNGLSMEVKTHATGGNILLVEAMPYTFAPTDTFTIWAGCRKRYTEDCGTKFSNKINFRGFPHLPGLDAVLRGP
jgi:uncharacterized phage protein (TIGR02218 family)